jgi:beta-galactosidase
LGLSEYGCEGIVTYHSDAPKMGDYSEEYQALYHEHMIRILNERPWIWGSYVWNMFDFGCDARDEGGVAGRNNKGLVTIDRHLKKDAFYLYKAFWSSEPMVHICGKRYAKRTGNSFTIKVYSNMPTLTLFVNNIEIDTKTADHIFIFENIPLPKGTHTIRVTATGEISDIAVFEIVDTIPEHYTLKEDSADTAVTNWFDGKSTPTDKTLTFKEGFYSIRNTVRDILKSEKAGTILVNAFGSVSGMKVKKSMLMMLADQTPESILKNPTAAQKFGMNTEDVLALVNAELQNIKMES